MSRMDISPKQLRTLAAIADHGGVAAAARAGHISQPAVTRTLRDLERRLEVRLFTRSPSGMTLTAAGEALLGRARRVLAELAAAEHEISALRGTARGRLVVGTLPFMRSSLVPVAVSRFLAEYPKVEVALVDESYEAMLRRVSSGEIDLIVGTLRDEPLPPDLRAEVLFRDPLCVFARSGHPLLARRRLALRDLAGADWVLPGRNFRQRRQLERIFADAGLPPPHTSVEAVSLSTIRTLLMESDRLTVASRQRFRYEETAGDLRVLPVPLPGTRRPIGIVTRRDALPSPVQRALVAQLKALARDPAEDRGHPARS